MAILPIVTYDDNILRQKTKPVKENSESLQSLLDDMFETMYNSNGVGLAAPQVGKLLQVFVMDADAITDELEETNLGPMAFINPEIIELSGEKVKMEEGCLSIPDVRDDVKRPLNAKVRYLNRRFEHQESEFSGWISRIIQHEHDHLQGVLFLDYLSAFKMRLHRSSLKKIDKGDIEAEYPLMPKKGLV
ncbi:MAG TPA: peptide deformylase [Balneolaceae bacterium]|nr:peptide deformylase [Balneolaceae bacterium]